MRGTSQLTCKAIQETLSASSLNTNDCFVLVNPNQVGHNTPRLEHDDDEHNVEGDKRYVMAVGMVGVIMVIKIMMTKSTLAVFTRVLHKRHFVKEKNVHPTTQLGGT